MKHCRGFVTGIVRGSLIGPWAGIAFGIFLTIVGRESLSSEVGPIPVLLGWACWGIPISAVAGGFVGSVQDALRVNDFERWLVVGCVLPIFLGLVVLPVVICFL